MYGAILGDIIGSPYEFDRKMKSKEFPLFIPRSRYTDDSVMTIAMAEALLDTPGQDRTARRDAVARSMQKWGRKYPDAGYGGKFCFWLYEENPRPYNSWGNGSAMRVSSAGWLYDTLEETQEAAEDTAVVTHNHPEGIKGAVATASVIWAARNGWTKEKIREYVEKEFYPLKETCDQIRPAYHFDVSCQGTVPQAVTAFLEGNSFTDVIRTAVSLGGDSDTLACIAGGMAEAYYGVPERLVRECRQRIPEDMDQVLIRFRKARSRRCITGQSAELNKLKVSDELGKNGNPERAKRLDDLLQRASRNRGNKEEYEAAMKELRKAFTAGEICPKTDEELEWDRRWNDTPWYPVCWRRGERATKMALELGIITEEDLEEEYGEGENPERAHHRAVRGFSED